jgi:hypothetical protein
MGVLLIKSGMKSEGGRSMKAYESGHVNGKNGTSKPKLKKVKVCVHQRVLGPHFNEEGQASGNLVCRECGAVVPDPVKV